MRGGSAVPAGVAPAAGAGAGFDSAGRVERKASDFPSGLQRGEVEDCGAVVNCQGARLPSIAAIQMEAFRRFCARSTFVTTYATNFPSGEVWGSLMNSNEK